MNITKRIETPGRVQSIFFIDESEICGRDYKKNELLSKLLSDSSDQQKPIKMISIVGMGGIGKITLAQMAYNDKDVMNNFKKRYKCVFLTLLMSLGLPKLSLRL